MRTYTRRKQIHGFIENVHEICRLCLQKIKDIETVELFTSESEKSCPSLSMKIMVCLGFEIANEECLPKLICTDCFDKINKYYIFRKKCGIAYHTLKSHSLAIKGLHLKRDATSNPQGDNCNENSAVTNYDKCEEGTIILSFEEGQQLKVINSDEVAKVDSVGLLNVADDDDDRPVPEISTFLTSILLELGIVEKSYVHFLKSDFIDNIIELETGDGCQMTLQLLESNEEVNSSVNEKSLTTNNVNNTASSTIKKQDEQDNGRPVCRECGKQFASRGVLRRHQRVHTGERPFACRACPRRFSQREVLRRHELVHQENRPYPCNVCSKSFTQRGSLEAHARTHLSPATRSLALHRCSVCPKMFLHASGLSRHMREHNGQSFSCDTCERQFRDRSSLLRHSRRHARGARSRTTSEANKTVDANNLRLQT